MKRIVLWFLSTLTVVVLLFGYHTSTSGPSGGGSSIVGSPAASGDNGSTTSDSASTITGPSVDTRWGPVQVEITVSGGKITGVTVPVYPTENPKDQEINSYALPILVDATIQAQSASIDMVSGATVTSQGYIQSLQSALDEANL
ncbi:FMN-binding protein [soil metagenome]